MGVVTGAFIVAGEPAKFQTPSRTTAITAGMGRHDDPLDEAYRLPTGQSLDLEIDTVQWRLTKQPNGQIAAEELRRDGQPGRLGHLMPQGWVSVTP
jgi:hypothetical protein